MSSGKTPGSNPLSRNKTSPRAAGDIIFSLAPPKRGEGRGEGF